MSPIPALVLLPGSGTLAAIPMPSPVQLCVVAVGAAILIAGFWLLSRARGMTPGEVGQFPVAPIARLLGPIRRSTLYTLAMCIMVLGYHIAAWAVPQVLGLHVPIHRAWILLAAIALAVVGSLVAERVEKE